MCLFGAAAASAALLCEMFHWPKKSSSCTLKTDWSGSKQLTSCNKWLCRACLTLCLPVPPVALPVPLGNTWLFHSNWQIYLIAWPDFMGTMEWSLPLAFLIVFFTALLVTDGRSIPNTCRLSLGTIIGEERRLFIIHCKENVCHSAPSASAAIDSSKNETTSTPVVWHLLALYFE